MTKYPAWDEYGDPQCERHGYGQPCHLCEDNEDVIPFIDEPSPVGHWRQPTPKMQATALLGAIRGNLDNLESGIITTEKLMERLLPLVHDLHDLHETAMPDSWHGIKKK